jgi:hypothetical protein
MVSHPPQLFHELKKVNKTIWVCPSLNLNGIAVSSRPWMKAIKVLLISMAMTAVMICVPMTRAQKNAELTGSVTDTSGAVIPNAQVTIADTGTGESHTATGNGAGLYGFSGLNHGVYTLKVEARGFLRSVLAREP